MTDYDNYRHTQDEGSQAPPSPFYICSNCGTEQKIESDGLEVVCECGHVTKVEDIY